MLRAPLVLATLLSAFLVLTYMAPPAFAQDAPVGDAEASQPVDGFGRTTPRGTVDGLVAAFASDDIQEVLPYLDLSAVPEERQRFEGRRLARQLEIALDRAGGFLPSFRISADPAGATGDGLAADYDRFATLRLDDGLQDLTLLRGEADGARVWRVSPESLQLVASTDLVVGEALYERWMPAALKERMFAGASWAAWIATVVLALCAIGLGVALVWTVFFLLSLVIRPLREGAVGRLTAPMRLPAAIVMGVPIFSALAFLYGVPVVPRAAVAPVLETSAWLALAWMVVRLIHAIGQELLESMTRREQLGAVAAISMARRIVIFFVILITAILIAGSFGLNLSGWFAALGIGGLAIALGAQKTIEHVVGGLSLIADQPLRVGDFCNVDGILGVVEDIGLRSTRIRTLDRSLVTIPNGDLASARIENYAGRTRFLWRTTIGLRYETTPAQMREVLRRIRLMMQADDRIAEDPRVRFIAFGASSLDVEIFAYVLAPGVPEYLAHVEDFNLELMGIVEACGTGFAFPSQTVYLARDGKPAAAEARMAAE